MRAKIILLFILFFFSFNNTVFPQTIKNPPDIVGEAGILIEAKTGKILYEKNANIPLEPASTTKIMTAIIAIERGDLNDKVTTSERAFKSDGSRIYLEIGETLTLEQMLYGLMLSSANDAAVAIAEHISGSVEQFAELMNAKAKEIGAKNTNFVNPSGLPDKNHYTTAYDLALISRYALNNPTFCKIVKTKTFNIPWQGKEYDRTLINHNKLLWRYEGADGVKTGYTVSAGQTIVASATRNGMQLLAVVLKSQGKNIYTDAISLLDYGFNNFKREDLVKNGEEITYIDVKYGNPVALIAFQDFSFVSEKDNNLPITKKIDIPKTIKAPLAKGAVIGKIDFYQGENFIGSVNLISKDEVKRKIYTYFWFRALLFLLLLYIPFRIKVAIKRYKRYKKNKINVSYLK
ncbi:D-alanyl-D-alanine carboxypeptidase family protein [Thermovenabulum gondwanense]|uniref:serine-type D-Ala-D-Ala carboxypeptidase n=1 Tax=Thermovenabulum gondwanense TaxID=520767 RepID=A0A161QD65_9FIRM|nr:D-alanyl-D-alanine carboxypeptidase family protein [Thermovenabulum gondwanense]KYO67773.1 D-alanyl-D-alanine carboxypeptidase DacF [Thermovenabulum gondwanense]